MTFMAVGVLALTSGEDLVWAVGKAVGVFLVSRLVLGYLGGLLLAVAKDDSADPVAVVEDGAAAGSEKG